MIIKITIIMPIIIHWECKFWEQLFNIKSVLRAVIWAGGEVNVKMFDSSIELKPEVRLSTPFNSLNINFKTLIIHQQRHGGDGVKAGEDYWMWFENHVNISSLTKSTEIKVALLTNENQIGSKR